ncbi:MULTISPECIES: SMI1/KNR4 family protein [Saccharibacillus]|uniref:SMI1/KNR4 family protein n=1 Tax=Saccharibacillus TaxID=456492 RepID=UPI00123846B0|nr:SMI1/KNR4 family protein [Saccharibacillus sp. WB 17]MWJ29605.1 hypothetical protein [Saccharibacillus sp. WB 17]
MWKIIEAYDRINSWIRASEGQFIELDNGESCRFLRRRTFTGQGLDEFEQASGIELPPEYRRFLIGVGAVELFAGPLGDGVQVLGPGEIEHFSRTLFDGRGENPYPALLPAVAMPGSGAFGAFRPASEREQRYGVFDFRRLPAAGRAAPGFASFDDWVAELADSRGKFDRAGD